MRLLQLNPTGDENEALDLHPMITVVTSLSPEGHAEVVRAASMLPFGQAPGYAGLVEAHGVLLDLDAEMLKVLDVHGGVDIFVRPDDLPGSARAVASLLPASVEPLSPEQFLEVTPRGMYPELDELRHRVDQSQETLDVLREALERAKHGLEDASIGRRRAELALEAVTGGGRSDLHLVGDGGGAAEPDDGLGPRARIEARQRDIVLEVERIDRGIGELAAVDIRPLQVLLDAIHTPPSGELEPSERGQQLADEFVRLQREVAALEDSLDSRGFGSAAAMARLDAARAELNEAEKAMRPPEFTDADRAELEAAHDAVIEAERKARGRGGRKRLEEAIEHEQQVLDRMGFPTWSAYVMGASLMGIDPAAEQRLERARFEYEAAERHWSDVAAMIEADPVHRNLLDQLEAVYLEAYQLVGGDDEDGDLEQRLRDLQEPKRDVSLDELVDALAYQLELVGMGLPPESVTLDRVVLIAEAFIEEASAIHDRIKELGDERIERLTELKNLEDEWESLPPDGEAVDAAEDPDAEGEAPEDEPEIDTSELEAALAAAREEEQEYADFVEAREALVDAATQVHTVATGRLHKAAADMARAAAEAEAEAAATDDAAHIDLGSFEDDSGASDEDTELAVAIQDYLDGRVGQLRSFSYAGSLPLVIDGAFEGLPSEVIDRVLGHLDRVSDEVQVIYLGNDPAVAVWAERVGFQRAAVVPAPAPFA